jgi:hypothetical protein
MSTEPSFRPWSHEVYETLHNTLSQVSEGSAAPLNQIAELLDICFPVFNNVLQNPTPSEPDRTKLLARMVLNKDLTDFSDVEFGRV